MGEEEKRREEDIVQLIPLKYFVPMPESVGVMDSEEDDMLRQCMGRHEKGLYKIDPILARPLTEEEKREIGKPFAKFMIIDGHQRWSIARDLHWRKIRAIIVNVSREEARELNYLKNRVRGRVDPIKEALYFKHLIDDLGMKPEDIAEKFGISVRHVYRILDRVKIKKELLDKARPYVVLGVVSGKHLEEISRAKEPERQKELLEAVIQHKLSRAETKKVREAVEEGKPIEEAIRVVRPPPEVRRARAMMRRLEKERERKPIIEEVKPVPTDLIEEARKYYSLLVIDTVFKYITDKSRLIEVTKKFCELMLKRIQEKEGEDAIKQLVKEAEA
ncbi:hypothetical protein DRN63_03340 [Nanoarchaeota archaeon]|nr:MAG: hypothetical protein DRN63_03340 [Nanoarchaeota archaeon]